MADIDPNADVTPEPVWDGEGVDPWLPARVNALLDVAQAEQQVYASVWAALAAWLVQTSRRVLSGPVPQPEAVFATAPDWSLAVDQIILDAILPVMSTAYRNLFGPDFPWEERPSVVGYLAQVKNRLVRTPDEVFNMITGQLAAGVTLGEGAADLAVRVDEVLSVTDSARWPNRATVIARTEAMGALNGSRFDAFQAAVDDEPDVAFERMWLSTVDSRTRPTHREADGQRVPVGDPFSVGGFPLMFPGDPAGPAAEVIQCRCTSLLVERGENVDLSNRQYRRR